MTVSWPKYWTRKFGRKIPPENFSKKKLFFLAMFKNEITTFKKKKFSTKKFFFRFFFKKKFSKMAVKSDWIHVFSWIFFFNRPVFSTASFEHENKTVLSRRIHEIGRFYTIFDLSEAKFTILPGKPSKNPKNNFFLFPTHFLQCFKVVFNIASSIPPHSCILKEPNVHMLTSKG